MTDDLLVFSGLDATTGRPLFPATTLADLARPLDVVLRSGCKARVLRGPREGIDAQRLDDAGWGVVFARDADPAVEEALEPLLARRQAQAGEAYRKLSGANGLAPGESCFDLVERFGAGLEGADPRFLPYYVLLVGGPEEIHFSFETSMRPAYAMGRLAFDTAEEYAAYARTVVASERGETARRQRRLEVFGPSHPLDRATTLAADGLVRPLLDNLDRPLARRGWTVGGTVGTEATRERLTSLVTGGPSAPGVVFLSSHGLGFPAGAPDQERLQGAPVCAGWQAPPNLRVAPPTGEPGVDPERIFSAEDLSDDLSPSGVVLFQFGCYGAGTPRWDSFPTRRGQTPGTVAPRPFVSSLARRLLAHPRGGALATVAHVDRAWSTSFSWRGQTGRTSHYEDTLKRLAAGSTLGHALEYVGQRGATANGEFLEEQMRRVRDRRGSPERLVELWTARMDARNTILLGDPAVRAAVGPPPPPRPEGSGLQPKA